MVISFIQNKLSCLLRLYKLKRYRQTIPRRVAELRRKDNIRVMFVLSDLPMWKTEELYKAMLEHPRFEPLLGTTPVTSDVYSEAIRKYQTLINYLDRRKYSYIELYSRNIKTVGADIVFYQQPYYGFISEAIAFRSIPNALFCNVAYGIHTFAATKKYAWAVDQPLHRRCWQLYMENDLTLKCGLPTLLKGKNMIATGVPMQDILCRPRSMFDNPWKSSGSTKKKIIWAPHHSIPKSGSIFYNSTILNNADFMLDMADKYKSQIQIAFKPHPFLKRKLYDLWGVEKTDNYYAKWQALVNTQLEEGEYLGLFKHSDALIHDCNSFIMEYCFMQKPIMFLVLPESKDTQRKEFNEFGQMAFDLHTYGVTHAEIELFIQQVIMGIDPKKSQREYFYNNYLLPPHGRPASQNIINAILGEAEYSDK